MEAKERYIIHRSFGELKLGTGMDNMHRQGHNLTPDFSATGSEVAAKSHVCVPKEFDFGNRPIEEFEGWFVARHGQAMHDVAERINGRRRESAQQGILDRLVETPIPILGF